MDKNYRKLFQEMCKSSENLAEQVLEYNINTKNTEGAEVAQNLRDEFAALGDYIEEKNTNNNELTFTLAQYRQLLAAAYTIMTSLSTHISNIQKSIDGYKLDIIPKLTRVINEGTDDEKLKEIENQLFDFSEKM